jgi:cytochrome c biogenesis protein CcmG, thiol:disulfide interchange protein DsbE
MCHAICLGMAQEFYSGKILYPVMVVLLVLSLCFGFAILPRLFANADGELVGKPAPAFSLPVVLNGGSASPSLSLAQFHGSAVVLDFWATWCGPCQLEAPVVNKLSQRFHDRGLVVVGVDTSEPNGQGPARAWAESHGLSYPIVFDTNDETARRYGVTSMPTLVVISRTGKVTAVREGLTSDAELESLVHDVL